VTDAAITKIVDAVKDASDSGAHLRIGKVTATQTDGARVQLDFTGDAWISCDRDVSAVVGDRVYALQQGSVLIVSGKIGAEAQSSGVPVGALTQYAGTSGAVPGGWLLCEGQEVSRTDFAVLFSRLGTTYGGGNGSTTFNLPNLQNRVPVGVGSRGRGATGGAETVTLSVAQMPSHNHGGVGDHTHGMGQGGGDPQVQSGTGATVAGNGDQTSYGGGAHTHASDGSGQSHENMPPFVVMYFIIRVL
jgi:microcystin-dependent protein